MDCRIHRTEADLCDAANGRLFIQPDGTVRVPFTLPAALRPTHVIYVPVDLCNANKGRLYIQPSGVVTVQVETAFSNAQCFTSLDGVSFIANP